MFSNNHASELEMQTTAPLRSINKHNDGYYTTIDYSYICPINLTHIQKQETRAEGILEEIYYPLNLNPMIAAYL